MDTRFSAEELAFRDEVRQFYAENWNEESQQGFDSPQTYKQALIDWQKRLQAKGLPQGVKSLLCDSIALVVYWPLARVANLVSASGVDVTNFPLALYRDRSYYTMRTDARDRFGTPLEKRFRADEIRQMMTEAGLTDIRFSDSPPFWCAVGKKA